MWSKLCAMCEKLHLIDGDKSLARAVTRAQYYIGYHYIVQEARQAGGGRKEFLDFSEHHPAVLQGLYWLKKSARKDCAEAMFLLGECENTLFTLSKSGFCFNGGCSFDCCGRMAVRDRRRGRRGQ